MTLIHHRTVDPTSDCGGLVASGTELFGTDHWCVYCGAKFNASRPDTTTGEPKPETLARLGL